MVEVVRVGVGGAIEANPQVHVKDGTRDPPMTIETKRSTFSVRRVTPLTMALSMAFRPVLIADVVFRLLSRTPPEKLWG